MHWTDIDIHYRGVCTRSGGHGFSALGRRELLGILQRRAIEVGVEIRFSSEAPAVDSLLEWADFVVGADGASSAVRAARANDFMPSLDPRFCRYMWLGTDLVFDAFKFFIEETPYGVMQGHAYPYSDSMSTFIVEMGEDGLAASRVGFRARGFPGARCLRRSRRPVLPRDIRVRVAGSVGVRQQLQVDQLRHRAESFVAV